tara:strand:+ start:410 stop:739 length:330 start_codon:yes stop_codon:yes gene_type:complete
VLLGVPDAGVGGGGIDSKLLLCGADSASVAVSGAHGPLAGHALVVIEALALSGLAVADSLVGALYIGVSLVGSSGRGDPGLALRAGPLGAIVLGPCHGTVGAGVARALV